MTERAKLKGAANAQRVIHHRVAQEHIEKHRHILAEHKKRGGPFAAAVERLERIFGEG